MDWIACWRHTHTKKNFVYKTVYKEVCFYLGFMNPMNYVFHWGDPLQLYGSHAHMATSRSGFSAYLWDATRVFLSQRCHCVLSPGGHCRHRADNRTAQSDSSTQHGYENAPRFLGFRKTYKLLYFLYTSHYCYSIRNSCVHDVVHDGYRSLDHLRIGQCPLRHCVTMRVWGHDMTN